MSYFEVFKDAAGEHRYRLVADNGEIVAQSEGYATAANAERGAADLVQAAKGAVSIQTDAGFDIDVRRYPD